MKIYMVRHGQSHWQLAPSENLNTSLTDLGHEQARLLGRWLAEHRMLDGKGRIEVATLRTSPLLRARETAEYTAKALDRPVCLQESLREAPFHVADHLPHRAAPFHAYSAFEPSEIYAAFKAQVRIALQELVEQAQAGGGPVLAITHGGIIKTLLRLIAGTDTLDFVSYNTGITLIEWKRGRWCVVHLNLLDHLPPEYRTI